MYSVSIKAKAHEYRVKAKLFFEQCHNRNTSAITHWNRGLAKYFLEGFTGCLISMAELVDVTAGSPPCNGVTFTFT